MGWTRNRFAAVCLAAASAWPLGAAPADAGSWKPPVFSRLDSLFLVAATGEPRFEPSRDSCEKLLLADTAALSYLLENRLFGPTPRHRHYVEKFFTAAGDSGRHPGPRRALAAALTQSHDTVRVRLLYLGSKLGDTAFRRFAVPYLRSDSVEVRRMAARCLGAYPHPENSPLLWDGLEKTSGQELYQRLWALDAHGPVREWRRLVPLLRDSLFFNRRKVRDLLLRAADSSWARLRPALPERMEEAERREWLLLALEAKGSGGFLAREFAGMPEAERRWLELSGPEDAKRRTK